MNFARKPVCRNSSHSDCQPTEGRRRTPSKSSKNRILAKVGKPGGMFLKLVERESFGNVPGRFQGLFLRVTR